MMHEESRPLQHSEDLAQEPRSAEVEVKQITAAKNKSLMQVDIDIVV